MNDKGYSTVETVLVFPVFVLLLAVLLFLLVSFALSDKKTGYDEPFIHRVYMTDSIKRKAAMISDIFE